MDSRYDLISFKARCFLLGAATLSQDTEGGYKLTTPGQLSECSLCRSDDFQILWSQTDKYGIAVRLCVCDKCGFRQLNPRRSDAEAERFYTQEYYELYGMEDKRKSQIWMRRKDRIAQDFAQRVNELVELPGKSFIDVGCGYGHLLRAANALGAQAQGIEPSSEGKEYLLDGDIPVVHGSLDAFISDGSERFDVVTACHVVEHVNEPVTFLRTLSKLVNDDGILVVEVPNTQWQVEVGYHPLSTHSAHVSYFTPKTLSAAYRLAGLTVVDVSFGLDGGTLRVAGSRGPESPNPAFPVDAVDRVIQETIDALARLRPTPLRRVLSKLARVTRAIWAPLQPKS